MLGRLDLCVSEIILQRRNRRSTISPADWSPSCSTVLDRSRRSSHSRQRAGAEGHPAHGHAATSWQSRATIAMSVFQAAVKDALPDANRRLPAEVMNFVLERSGRTMPS